jgi:radical SAM-linked protein
MTRHTEESLLQTADRAVPAAVPLPLKEGCAVNSIRVKFNRGHQVKFISHLDLMKSFERAIRRSGLPIVYSQGFNPHPAMVFGLPLSVGVTSEAEYADFETVTEVAPAEFMERLSKELPEGLKLIKAGEKRSGGNIMASISAAMYEIMILTGDELNGDELAGKTHDFMGRSSIIATKEGKNGPKDIDIRPMIRSLKAELSDKIPEGFEALKAAIRLTVLLDAGSVSNLKPEMVASAFLQAEGIKAEAVRIHRKALYVGTPDKLADPLDGSVIMK